jgi:hypothetical protein
LTAETHLKTAKKSQKAKIEPQKVGVKVLKPQQQPGNNLQKDIQIFYSPKKLKKAKIRAQKVIEKTEKAQ